MVCTGAGGSCVDMGLSACSSLAFEFGDAVVDSGRICFNAAVVSAEMFLTLDLLCMKRVASDTDPWCIM